LYVTLLHCVNMVELTTRTETFHRQCKMATMALLRI